MGNSASTPSSDPSSRTGTRDSTASETTNPRLLLTVNQVYQARARWAVVQEMLSHPAHMTTATRQPSPANVANNFTKSIWSLASGSPASSPSSLTRQLSGTPTSYAGAIEGSRLNSPDVNSSSGETIPSSANAQDMEEAWLTTVALIYHASLQSLANFNQMMKRMRLTSHTQLLEWTVEYALQSMGSDPFASESPATSSSSLPARKYVPYDGVDVRRVSVWVLRGEKDPSRLWANPFFISLWREIWSPLFFGESNIPLPRLLGTPVLLRLPEILLIASALNLSAGPASLALLSSSDKLEEEASDLASQTWRCLFTSKHHGKSWTIFQDAILDRGTTLILIRTVNGHVFGGYASVPWKESPGFYGDSSSFLFTSIPDLHVYHASGWNTNYQYFNHGKKSLPNGLGMGGQIEDYFSLFIEENFVHGYCKGTPLGSTFQNPPLHGNPESWSFTIDFVEVWCLKAKEVDDRLIDPRRARRGNSVLDSKEADLLEMHGKTLYSRTTGSRKPDQSSSQSSSEEMLF